MTEQTDAMKALGLETMNDTELLWSQVVKDTELAIKNFETALTINKALLEMAQSKLKNAA